MIRLALGLALVSACGSVSSRGDAAVGSDVTTIDGEMSDGAIDTIMLDAFGGPPAQLRWNFENNLDNVGAMSGYTFTAPSGVSYVTGKTGMAVTFGTVQYAPVTGMRGVIGTFSKVTIAMWLKEPGNINNQSVLDVLNRNSGPPYGGLQLGFANDMSSLCVASTTVDLLSGGCSGPDAPTANAFHHWIFRYDGAGLAAGQGAGVDVYIDGALAYTRANSSNNPVFTSAIPDSLTISGPGAAIDDLRIYNQVFTAAEQCTYIIGGTYSGTTCTLP